jgi:hypothetical protein
MAPVPAGAQRSEDGYYWWDGQDWQSVPDDDPQHPNNAADGSAPAAAGSSSAAAETPPAAAPAGGNGEVTKEDLQHITSEEQIDDKAHPYFAPDYDAYPNDTSESETSDHLSDEPVPAGGA